jgi:hypothetical protein
LGGRKLAELGAEHVVFAEDGEPTPCIADEQDRIMIDRATVDKLGSVEAIFAYFDAADIAVPPLEKTS